MRKLIPNPDPGAKEFIMLTAAETLDGGANQLLPKTESCLRKLAFGIGFSVERPLTDVGIPAFYDALRCLGFKLSLQSIAAQLEGDFVDLMVMKSVTTGRIVHLYNRVSDLEDVCL